MGVPYYGDFPTGHTGVVIPFNTFDSNDPSASVTIGEFANTDVHIHKNGSLTQRSSASGVAIDIDVDAITGGHWVTIDLSDNTDAGFYAAGSEISVRIEGTTVDGATVNAFIGSFSIERAGGVLALIKAGTVKVDVETIKTRAITCGAAVTIRADVGAAAAPGAANGMLIGGSNAATTFATLSVTGQLDAGNLLIDGTTVLTGNTSIGGTFGITGAATLASLSITGQLDAGNVLVDTTTVLTGAVTLSSTLATGAVTFASVAISGALSVGTTTTLTGNVSLGGTLGITGTTTLAALSVTGQLDAGNLLIDTTTTLTGNVSLGGTLGITGTTTLAALSVTGQLDAGNLLIDTTTVFTGAVSAPAGITANITGNITGNLSGSVGTLSGAVTLANGAHGGAGASLTLADYSAFKATGFSTHSAADVWSSATRTLTGTQSFNLTGNITGNLSGSVGSVTGAVGSVTGSVGSVTGAVGSVTGSVGSISGVSFPANFGSLGINASGHISRVTLCDTTTTNSDMSGIKKNTELANFQFLMVLASDHVTPATGKTITATRSIDGAAFAACANAAAEVASGVYKITLAAADLNGDIITLKFSETDCDTRYITIITES